jgi:hypothetical protein
MNEQKFAALLRGAQATNLPDPEDAAVFIADESGHPWDWRLILTDRGVYRRRLRAAENRTPPELQEQLLDAKKSLDRRHRL